MEVYQNLIFLERIIFYRFSISYKYLIHMYPVAIIIPIIVSGVATFMYSRKPILWPSFDAIPLTITFAEAPINVAFPPMSAPSARAHHSGPKARPEIVPTSFKSGIIVATNGMLSIIAEKNADPHRTEIVVAVGFPPVNFNNCSASIRIAPTSSRPVTKTNNPMKKNIVVHSTSFKCDSGSFIVSRRSSAAPASAIVAPSK